MAPNDVDRWAITAATFKERYPPELVSLSPVLTSADDIAPDGNAFDRFLDEIVVHLATIQVVVLDHLADNLDEEAVKRRASVCRDIRGRALTLGVTEHRILRGPNTLGDGIVALGMARVNVEDAPNALLVATFWDHVLSADAPLAVDIRQALEHARDTRPGSRPWSELLRVLIAIRNTFRHVPQTSADGIAREIAVRLPPAAWLVSLRAAVELGVTGPADVLLRRFTTGRRQPATEVEGKFVCSYLAPGSHKVFSDYKVGDTQDTTSGPVVLRFDNERSMNDPLGEINRWAVPIGPFRTPHEICRDGPPIEGVSFTHNGEGWLSAGTVETAVIRGKILVLQLPIDSKVQVSFQARSAPTLEGATDRRHE